MSYKDKPNSAPFSVKAHFLSGVTFVLRVNAWSISAKVYNLVKLPNLISQYAAHVRQKFPDINSCLKRERVKGLTTDQD